MTAHSSSDLGDAAAPASADAVSAHAPVAQLLTMLKSISQGVFLVGEDRRVIAFNPRVCELLDLPESYLQTCPDLDAIGALQFQRGDFGPDYAQVQAHARVHFNAPDRTAMPDVYLRTTPAGKVLEVRSQMLPTGGMVRTFTDITDYVQAEASLRASEELFRQITSEVPGVVYRLHIGPEGQRQYSFVSPGVRDMYGLEPEAVMADGYLLQRYRHPDDRVLVEHEVATTVRDGLPLSAEFRIVLADGTQKWVQMSSSMVSQDATGTVRNGVMIDITARKHAQTALRERDALWKLALESTGDGVWDWYVQTGVEVYSKRCVEMYGYAEGELQDLAAELDERTHPDDVAQMRLDRQAHYDGLTPSYTNEHRIRCKDGSWKWVLSRGMVISRDEQGKPLRMTGTHTDITDRKNAETLGCSE